MTSFPPPPSEDGCETANRTTIDVEILGRKRPEMFKTRAAELGFCFSLLASMMMEYTNSMQEYFISGFNIILPSLATALDIPPDSQTWPASVFSLVTGAFLLPFGRAADIYGGGIVFVCGLLWYTIWSLIGGFSQNYLMLNFCRSLQGFGPAAFLPSGVMLLGSIYRPGPRKNLVFSLYGACSPMGFFLGIFLSGLSGQYLPWNWDFYIGTILLAIVTVIAFFTVPLGRYATKSDTKHGTAKMDWLGFITIVPGLILVVFGITDSSHAPNGWATPYIYITFIIGGLLLCTAFYIEGWVAEQPLLPFDLFASKYMKPLCVSLFFSYGVFGIYLFYASFYIETIVGATPLLTTAWFAPMAIGGLVLATVGGFTLHHLSGTLLLAFSTMGYLISALLFALMPAQPNFWAWVFPAMVCATIGIDISYSVSNVFITTSLPSHQQGTAGGLVNCLVFVGISFFLGFADFAASSTKHLGVKESYQVAFWFAVGIAGFALVLIVFGIRIDKAKSDLTVDEKRELHKEALRSSDIV
ncbi:uncharacterized protein N7511_010938 [Penicillium nucicola]|uniref:uncharacterized protein n=1 Tax=Penicillium nucicola TaxID=1850975 RepID=UPI002544F80C|nr:uncharacterized protein N7511_010938 [Penicillium nucicola]KAJ5749242.1 hypothetical protein N7511_010938 [Penicillium nucicola]